ncbi:MAG TPA: amidohydrolase [Candidatus Corynebacterium gallistercoris]|uniref:Amidohydrolase n=1 Tax=Candidatus Corynebacterium gallistercoris TaxID=2838530 RepID=A0A9D1UR01_9CORY|nr:amidohydrolase [Candidatus Corynebacterium gallistercoris]
MPNPQSIADFVRTHGVDLSWQQEFYRWMHAHPELSLQEERTAAFIREKLEGFGCDVTTGIGGHGITAVWRNGEGPTVLFRADFDALPVTETTGLDYASQTQGVMHACGHDVHTSALMGLCAVADKTQEQWSGTLIALFQPAEEVTRGANMMIADGLDDIIPAPDVCLGQHVVPQEAGVVMSAPGPVLAACDTITITLHGRSAHGSQPHEAIDPTYLAAMIVVRLQGIVGRETSPEDFAVITVGTLSSGHTNNTIPDTATLVLNCRFYDTDVRDRTYEAIKRVVRGECIASGSPKEPEFGFSAHGELTDNSPAVFEHVRPVFDATFGERSITAERWTASEDFSEIPRHFGVPYLFWTVGATSPALWNSGDPVPGNHSGDFAPTQEALEAATDAAIAASMSYLLTT